MSNYTFEQLCVRKQLGYSYDLETMFQPLNPNCFDDVVFKIISKIDTSLLLLHTQGTDVESFTVVGIPTSKLSNSENTSRDARTYQGRKQAKPLPSKVPKVPIGILEDSWEYLSNEGWHGMQSLALLRPESIPDNGARNYSLYQYTACIIDVVRANYMFQKYRNSFYHEIFEMFDKDDIEECTEVVFGLIWKRSLSTTLSDRRLMAMQGQKRKQVIADQSFVSKFKKPVESAVASLRNSRRQILQNDDDDDDDSMVVDEDSMVVDDEISFKNPIEDANVQIEYEEASPSPPPITKGRRKPPPRKEPPSPPPSSTSLADVTLGFETSITASKGGRKSMAARKSMSGADWPEEERRTILNVFDNLNPEVSEQKRIALTCKYVTLQLGKDLPSKLLYQWIQKKGREVNRTITSFDTPEVDEQKQIAIRFYKELDESSSEPARVSFTLKYLEVQYGLIVTSKQFYTWLLEKPKKQQKKR